MKKYIREIIVLVVQLFVFYIFPLFAVDAIGMVVSMLLLTFLISVIIGSISKERIKYLYPIVVSIVFIPSIFIYYNESAMIHSIWYLVISALGLLLGIFLHK